MAHHTKPTNRSVFLFLRQNRRNAGLAGDVVEINAGVHKTLLIMCTDTAEQVFTFDGEYVIIIRKKYLY